jgi:hypothetical protein
MARGIKLPLPTTRINIRVFSSDWDYLQSRDGDSANETLRNLLAAYVRHQKTKTQP